MYQNNRLRVEFSVVLFCAIQFINTAFALSDAEPKKWDDWANEQKLNQSQLREEDAVVQDRVVTKSKRLQVVAPMFGMSERKDFFNNYMLTTSLRYHFSETHGWELLRLTLDVPVPTSTAVQIQNQTSYSSDVQISRFQMGTSYIFTPIYGKYAWDTNQLVYFDIFGTAGGGLRFTQQIQPYGEIGIGMNHYILGSFLSIIPELRERIYAEQRTTTVAVFETIFQVGIAWLL